MLIPELGLYHYRARAYSAYLGRFLQADPAGYADGLNLYAYGANDPINATDPSGLGAIYCRPNHTLTQTYTGVAVTNAKTGEVFFDGGWDITHNVTQLICDYVAEGIGGSFPGNSTSPPEKEETQKVKQESGQSKPLPPCLQNFLKGRLKSNPADIRLHQGSPFELTGNSVTFGNDVYLAGDTYGRSDRGATIHKFHEIQHTSQYARGYSALNQAFAYVAFGGHDASPFEQAADTFAQDTYDAYKAAGLDKTCRF